VISTPRKLRNLAVGPENVAPDQSMMNRTARTHAILLLQSVSGFSAQAGSASAI
jgi:hypothetical protein